MTLTLEKGSNGKFVEIEEKDEVKRFLVPEMEGLEGRLQSLIQRHPGLSLVRIGRAVVASKDEVSPLTEGLEAVPSDVLGTYVVDFCGDHPVIGQGPARYSQTFIQQLAHLQPVTVSYQAPVEQGQLSTYDFTAKPEGATAVVLPKPDLAASLRQQVEQQKTPAELMQEQLNAKLQEQKAQPVAEKSEIEVVPSEKPTLTVVPTPDDKKEQNERLQEELSETQRQLNEAIEEAKRKRGEDTSVTILHSRPRSKIDLILEHVESISAVLLTDVPEQEVTPEELDKWFYDHISTVGRKKTFEILAKRLKR